MSTALMRNAQIAGPADCMHLGSSVYSDFDDFKRDDGTPLALPSDLNVAKDDRGRMVSSGRDGR
jgi:hypothetical protein